MKLPFELSIKGVVDFQTIDRSQYTHIISIWHPNPNLQVFKENMEIGFPGADIHFAIYNDVEWNGESCATSGDVQKTIEYARKVPAGSHLLVHCMAGVSRSTATAMAILADHHGAGNELEIATYIREIRPQANPNRLVCSLADEILESSLQDAADEIYGQTFGEFNKGWLNEQELEELED